jgi:hypothetical protein
MAELLLIGVVVGALGVAFVWWISNTLDSAFDLEELNEEEGKQ